MSFVTNHTLGAGSISGPDDQQSSALPLCYGHHIHAFKVLKKKPQTHAIAITLYTINKDYYNCLGTRRIQCRPLGYLCHVTIIPWIINKQQMHYGIALTAHLHNLTNKSTWLLPLVYFPVSPVMGLSLPRLPLLSVGIALNYTALWDMSHDCCSLTSHLHVNVNTGTWPGSFSIWLGKVNCKWNTA